MTEEYKFIANNSKECIESQLGIYMPIKEVEQIMKKWADKQLLLQGVSE